MQALSPCHVFPRFLRPLSTWPYWGSAAWSSQVPRRDSQTRVLNGEWVLSYICALPIQMFHDETLANAW